MRTLTDLAGVVLPANLQLDGEIITDVLLKDAPSPHDVLYYYCKDRLMAVRSGPYKVHFYTQRVQPQEYFTGECLPGGQPIRHYFDCYDCADYCVTYHDPPIFYNVENDPIEAFPLNMTMDPILADFWKTLRDKVNDHTINFFPAPPILHLQDKTRSTVPCCNPETNCICNFGPVDGPYN